MKVTHVIFESTINMQINLSPELAVKYEELRRFYQQHDSDIIEAAIVNLHDKVIAVTRAESYREAWLAENGYGRECTEENEALMHEEYLEENKRQYLAKILRNSRKAPWF